MVVSNGPATIGEKELRNDWPNTEGITAGTTKQRTEKPSLEPEVKAMESGWGCV